MPRGTYAPNVPLYEGNTDLAGFVVHPDDVVGTDRHPDLNRWMGCCQGPAGHWGPNLVCSGCGAEVATRQSDCCTQDQVAFEFAAVCLSFIDD
jgi:hypothetical protein